MVSLLISYKKRGSPQLSKNLAEGTIKSNLTSQYSTCSSLPSVSFLLLRCFSPFLVSTSLGFPHGSLLCYLCVFLCADNSCSDLSWTALESGGSCLLLYWGMCLLYCKDEGPWILDILPFSPLLLLPSHLDTATVCSDLFFLFCFVFYFEWQRMA